MNRRTFLRSLSAIAASIPLLGIRKTAEANQLTRDTFAVPGWIIAGECGKRGTIVTECTLDGVSVSHQVWAANELTGEVVFTDPSRRAGANFDERGNPLGILRRGRVAVIQKPIKNEAASLPIEFTFDKKQIDEISDQIMRRVTGDC